MPEEKIRLSFCEITKIDDFLLELTPYSGIEIRGQEIRGFHHCLNQLEQRVGVLLNNINSHSFSFLALMEITRNRYLGAIAILEPDIFKQAKSEYLVRTIRGIYPYCFLLIERSL